ncbi:MAG: rhodanese-like domain-containing protein [Candidatus Gastranaerophilales bacterium]|nr:rhodanese-like domain-containing protein [Candidatus Gastranaerophilales bacterium]
MIKIEELTKNTEKAAEFFADKLAFTLGPAELKKLHETNPDGIQIIDVRHADVYMKSHIPDAISIPADNLSISMHHLSKDKINIVYCYNEDCHLAARVAKSLAEMGYPVMELQGGFESWREKDFDMVTSG